MPNNVKLDLNSAEVTLLTQLPGVGKNVAYEIVNYREQHGGFSGWEDLKKIRSLPQDKKTLEALQSRAFLGARPEPKTAKERHVLTRNLGKTDDESHNRG